MSLPPAHNTVVFEFDNADDAAEFEAWFFDGGGDQSFDSDGSAGIVFNLPDERGVIRATRS